VVSPAELDALARLGDALKVPARPREIVDGIAQDVANLSDDRPSRYDLPALRQLISERLQAAHELRTGSHTG
jgi:hypothetical protein